MKKKGIIIMLALFNQAICFCQHRDSIVPVHKHKNNLIRKFTIPSVLLGLGIYGTTDNSFINHDEIREDRFEYFPGFTNKADNYLQFAPIPAVFIMDACGMKSQHSPVEQLWLLGKSQAILFSIVYPLKKWTHILRPDSSSYNSFPSGHTAQAFLAATFFYKEYGKKYPLLSIGMFTIATGIGAFRILNNKHWISDVLAGAGIGILSVELSYMLPGISHHKINKLNVYIIPAYLRNHLSCTALLNIP